MSTPFVVRRETASHRAAKKADDALAYPWETVAFQGIPSVNMPIYKVHRSELKERRQRQWYLKFRFAALMLSSVLLVATMLLLIGYALHPPS